MLHTSYPNPHRRIQTMTNSRTLSIVAAFGMLITFGVTSPLSGQDVGVGQDWASGGQLSLPVDWSFNHVIYTGNLKSDHTAEHATKMKNDPRLFHSWLLQGHLPTAKSMVNRAISEANNPGSKKPTKPHRDWSLSLGSGGIAQNMSPAKFSFNIGSTLTTANCVSDFVVFGLNVAGTATQANIVAIDNLYSGTSPTGLCGTAPTVKWAYKVATLTSGEITTSPVLSLDGTQVAFVESNGSASVLHVLKWLDSNGTVGAPVTPTAVTSTVGCTAPCMVSLEYDSSHGTTLSSPFYDYQVDDALYVGNDNGELFRITGIFGGTPAVATTNGWSATGVAVAAAAVKMTGAILDFNSGNIFVGGSDGKLYAVLSTNAATQHSIAVGSGNADGGGIVDAPDIDGFNGTVLAYAAANATDVGGTSLAANTSAVTVQANTTTPFGLPQVATIGEGTLGTITNLNTHSGTFDNSYLSWSGSGANTGHFYVIGTANAATSPTLYQLPFSGVASVSPNAGGSGYKAPVVSFTGGGSGASATATGGVDNVLMGGAGSYSTVPTGVTFTGTGSGASGTIHFGLNTIGVTTAGSGYTAPPAITISATGGGSGGSATAYLGVVSYAIGTNTGTFNTSNATTAAVPTVAVSAPAGPGNPLTTATATATYGLAASAGVVLGSTAGNGGCVAGAYNIGGGISGTTDTVTISLNSSGIPNSVTAYTHTRAYNTASPPTAPTTICGHAVNISSVTEPGGFSSTYTATTQTAHGFSNGDSVTITGVTCSSCGSFAPNGTFTVSSVTSTTFHYSSTGTVFSWTSNSNTGTVTDNSATQPKFNWQVALSTLVPNVQGSGYQTVPSVTFSPTPTGTVMVTPSLGVTSVALVAAGDYTGTPSASIAGNATLNNITWKVNSVAVTAPSGSGYNPAPTVGFTGGTGTAATATATLRVTGFTLNYGGGGYPSSATATIADSNGGTGTGATATITVNPGSVMTPGTSTTKATVNATSAVEASPLNEIFTNASTDLLFYGYGLTGSVGDIASQNVTGGSISAATIVAEPNANGGTSGIVVDNISTQAQASSIYFGTLATSTTQCGATAAYCAVKLTQSGLQ
jgi:hypothetical protein